MIEKFQQQKTSGGPAAGGTTTSGGPTLEGKFGNLVRIRKCYFNIFSVLEGHSQTTERATKTALPSSTTSTTMASGDLFTHIFFCCSYLLYIDNYFLQVPRRFVPPQKAYNLRGVVSRKQDLEIL